MATGKTSSLPPKPAVDPADRLPHLVKDLGKLFSRALQMRLAEQGIAYGHWTFLRILWKHDGISQAALSRLAGVMAPSTATAVRTMEELGYVVRKQKPGNRKTIYVGLTSAGRALEARLVPLAVDVNDIATGGLSDVQIEQFRRTLIAMIDHLQRPLNAQTPRPGLCDKQETERPRQRVAGS